jgi:cardiolipin synthase
VPAFEHPIDIAFGVAVLVAALIASGHAVLYKREPRSSAVWLLVIWILPAAGPILYALLGINRVERRAGRFRRRKVRQLSEPAVRAVEPATHFAPLARLVGRIVERPLVPGNLVEPLVDGTSAYPAMLDAIAQARSTIALASYIFDGAGIGAQFVQALGAAVKRGVEVRVLIDDVDARFSRSSAVKPLRAAGVNVAVFNPPFVPARLHAVNLRNHRKILVVDGTEGFTGGLNVDMRYAQPEAPDKAFRDLHFRLRGPIVTQLTEVFAEDWQFTTGEALRGALWFPVPASAGDVIARAIEAGPDESIDRLRWAIIGGCNAAQRSIRIATPYFLPDSTLIAALGAAALRGVEVDILLPERSDLPHVHWASFGQIWQVLERGCRVHLRPGAFDHSKLMVVDGAWTFLGSANWDARSLRLNFELNVECYSVELGALMEGLIQPRVAGARQLTMQHLSRRPFAVKLRDGVARLFMPYL